MRINKIIGVIFAFFPASTFVFVFTSCQQTNNRADSVAMLGGDLLTTSEFVSLANYWTYHNNKNSDTLKILHNWATNERLYLEALKQKFDRDKLVEKKVSSITKSLVASTYLDYYLSNHVDISTIEIRDFYKKNRKSFIRNKGSIKLVHFFTNTKDDGLKLKNLLSKEDHNMYNIVASFGGSLKLVSPGDFNEKIEKYLFSKKLRKVVGPLSFENKNHLFYIIERFSQNSVIGLVNLYGEITQILYQQKSDSIYNLLIDSLEIEYPLTVFSDNHLYTK